MTIFYQHKAKPDKDYWTEHFKDKQLNEYIDEGWNNRFVKILSQFLNPDNIVVEAGAGFGRYIKIFQDLHIRNYEGFDNNKELIRAGYEMLGVKIIEGDIFNSPYPDNYADVYIDFGTIEHFSIQEQIKILREASRITTKEGNIFIDVPYLNWKRKLAYPIMLYKNHKRVRQGIPFYQCIYSMNSIKKLINKAGLSTVRIWKSYSGVRMLVHIKNTK